MPSFASLQEMRESERHGTKNKKITNKLATQSFGAIIPKVTESVGT
jgi:hypothetical protein